jgi:hypothetical protein
LLGYELIHFDHLAVKEFIYEFICFEFLFFSPGCAFVCNQVDVDGFIDRESKPPKTSVAANLERPFDLSGNSCMVRMPVEVEHDVDGAQKLEVERVARWKELSEPILIPVDPESAS